MDEWITIGGEIGRRRIDVVTRPGFPGWNEVSRAEMLLAKYAEIEEGERVLVQPGGHGALGVWLAEETSAGEVILGETNAVAAEATDATCRQNRCGERARVHVGLPADAGPDLDVALLRAPKGRDLARLLFLEALHALRPGGRMYLAGANREGIKSLDKDATALFGPGRLLGYKGGNRAFLYTRPEHPPEPLPDEYLVDGVRRDTWHEYTVETGDDAEPLLIRTRPGVFSWRALDAGTRALLEVLPVRATDRVLDVGAGAGASGLTAARRARHGTRHDGGRRLCSRTSARRRTSGPTASPTPRRSWATASARWGQSGTRWWPPTRPSTPARPRASPRPSRSSARRGACWSRGAPWCWWPIAFCPTTG